MTKAPQQDSSTTPRPTSKIDKFKKQQSDGTKVGKAEQAIMPAVAGAIEKGGRVPVLGKYIINPAMRMLETFGERVVQPLTQGVSTALLTPQAAAAKQGSNLIENFRFAKKQAEKISMGQALAGAAGKISVYINAGVLTVQNQTGFALQIRTVSLRTFNQSSIT